MLPQPSLSCFRLPKRQDNRWGPGGPTAHTATNDFQWPARLGIPEMWLSPCYNPNLVLILHTVPSTHTSVSSCGSLHAASADGQVHLREQAIDVLLAALDSGKGPRSDAEAPSMLYPCPKAQLLAKSRRCMSECQSGPRDSRPGHFYKLPYHFKDNPQAVNSFY